MLGEGTFRDQLGKGCMLLPTGMDTDFNIDIFHLELFYYTHNLMGFLRLLVVGLKEHRMWPFMSLIFISSGLTEDS